MPLTRFIAYAKSRDGVFSLLVVLICGLQLSFFTGLTFVDPIAKSYDLDFGSATWIQPCKPAPCAYFRKDLYLPGNVDRAWVQLAATDNFILYVNHVTVGEKTLVSTCVSGIYDLKMLLRPGKNVIAVGIDRSTFPGSGQLLLRGYYSVVGSPLQEFYSDTGWKASSTPDGIVGGYSWSSPLLDDSFWADAQPAPSEERFFPIQSVAFDPRILQGRTTAKWIASPRAEARQVTFSYHLNLPYLRKETWLQVAATGEYQVVINGIPLFTNPSAAISSSPAPASESPVPVLVAYEVTRWMRSGDNSLEIRVEPETGSVALLAEGYTVRSDSSLLRFATDGTWKTALYRDAQGLSSEPALVVGDYGSGPWGIIHQVLAPENPLPTEDYLALWRWAGVILAVTGGTFLVWLIASAACAAWRDSPVEHLWTADAFLHLLLIAVMSLLWLLTFDVRFPPDWCYKPEVLAGLCLLLLSSKFLLFDRRTLSRSLGSLRASKIAFLGRYWKTAALICVIAAGFAVRAWHLNAISIDTDEMGQITFSRGVHQIGYPFIHIGSFLKTATTYELVPYSIAVSTALFGENDSTVRYPSLLYGTLTIGLIAWVGYRMMGWRVGFVSALIFAFFPCAIYWSRNCFWPAQEQLLALFTVWCFYEGVKGPTLRHKYITAAAVGFTFSYLTWEGSGFLLVACFACMFAMQWGKHHWMSDWHLWRCLFIMAFVVVVQQAHRQLDTRPPYLQMGYSLADLTTPEIMLRDSTKYDPLYYYHDVLTQDNIFTISAILLYCTIPCWNYRPVRYLVVAVATLLACFSQLLPAYSLRYSTNYHTFMILAAVGIFFKLWDRIGSTGEARGRFWWTVAAGWGARALFLAALLLATNGFMLKTYRLSFNKGSFSWAWRIGNYRDDYRGAATFVANHIKPGDAVVVMTPHVFEFYSHLKGDYELHPNGNADYTIYSINTMIANVLTYDGGLQVTPQFADKFVGYPLIRSLDEIEVLRNHHPRVWIVLMIFLHSNQQSPRVNDYMEKNERVVFESYNTRVSLMEGAQSLGGRQPGEPGQP
jgi:hypothetical protein